MEWDFAVLKLCMRCDCYAAMHSQPGQSLRPRNCLSVCLLLVISIDNVTITLGASLFGDDSS